MIEWQSHERRNRISRITIIARPIAGWHLGAGLRQPVHGHLVRDDPRSFAGVSHLRPARKHRNDRLIEGVGEATASISKLFSGWASDKLGKRKALAVIGYGLGALSKSLFALAPTSSLVLAARFSDRVGKGIRGAPRDAMVGDMVPAGLRRAAYGLRQALDTIGAFAGPLIAIALMATLHDNFRLIFWLALIPGLISVLVLLVAPARTTA
jgi:Major Facilitator Superfamily